MNALAYALPAYSMSHNRFVKYYGVYTPFTLCSLYFFPGQKENESMLRSKLSFYRI